MNGRLLRIVLDTNIVISAVLTRDGLESKILRHALSGEFRLYASIPILNEYFEVLRRPKFRFSEAAVQQVIDGIEFVATVVAPRRSLKICSDPGDNMFLECAEASHAEYLITGNLQHFPAAWKSTRVVSSRQFLISIAGPLHKH